MRAAHSPALDLLPATRAEASCRQLPRRFVAQHAADDLAGHGEVVVGEGRSSSGPAPTLSDTRGPLRPNRQPVRVRTQDLMTQRTAHVAVDPGWGDHGHRAATSGRTVWWRTRGNRRKSCLCGKARAASAPNAATVSLKRLAIHSRELPQVNARAVRCSLSSVILAQSAIGSAGMHEVVDRDATQSTVTRGLRHDSTEARPGFLPARSSVIVHRRPCRCHSLGASAAAQRRCATLKPVWSIAGLSVVDERP